MARLLIAYDSADRHLGDYFLSCRHDICAHAEACNDFLIDELDSEHDDFQLEQYISTYAEQPFIFVAYAHGCSDAVLLSGTPLVHNRNTYFFGKSLFYTCACDAGISLSENLRAHNCYAFIGFTDKSNLQPRATDYVNVFMSCENYGLKLFMGGGVSIVESFEKMRTMYSDQAISLLSTNPVAASLLLANGNALYLDAQGQEHLTIADFQ